MLENILTLPEASHQKLSEAVWHHAIENGLKIATELQGLAQRTLEALDGMPWECLEKIACTQEGDRATLWLSPHTDPKPWMDKLSGVLPPLEDNRIGDSTYVTLVRGVYVPELEKMALDLTEGLKNPMPAPQSTPEMPGPQSALQSVPDRGYSPALASMGEIGGYLQGGRYGWSVPGVPRHLQGMLASGIIGGAMGYGAGWLGSKLLPPSWNRKRLPRTLATLGAVAGMSPGAALAGINMLQGKSVFDDSPLAVAPNSIEEPLFRKGAYHLANLKIPYKISPFLKSAISQTGSLTGYDVDLSPTPISIDKMNQNLFEDPRVYQSLPMPLRAATSGVLESAYALKDRGRGGPRFVTPADIARISAGMGSGYLSGAIVGKALGALVGMPEQTQDRLKSIGLWSGVVANVVPLLF